MTALEQLPDTWDSDRDERFFRITARLLPSSLVEAASALLSSYDDEAPSGLDVARAAAGATSGAHLASRPPAPVGGSGSSSNSRHW